MLLSTVHLDDPIEVQAATIGAACRSDGFFSVARSCVDRRVADDAWHAAAAFFERPLAEKRLVEFPEPGYPYGYSPFGFETLARSLGEATPADLKESLSVGPDAGAHHVSGGDAAAWVRSPSVWPDSPARLRAAWSAYYQALSDVAARLLRAMAVALDMPQSYFDSMIDGHISSMRAIHYPALDSVPTDGALRAGAHSDYGTLTILRTDEVSGLEIQALDGSWQAIHPDPDTFVVNLGDSIAQWTNDRWRSTVHRVAVTDLAARQSMAYFHMANWDAMIECVPTCRTDGQPDRYAPAQAGPWLMQKFQSTVATTDS